MAEPLTAPVAVLIAGPPETPAWRHLACAVIEQAIRDLCLPPTRRCFRPMDTGPAPQREAAHFFADADSPLTFWAQVAGLDRALIVERVWRLHGDRLAYWIAQPAPTGDAPLREEHTHGR